MKKIYFKHFLVTLLLLCCTVASAHDFSFDGIYYNVTNATNKTVEVTYRGTYYNQYSNEYTGSVVIPSSVTYNGTTYSVTTIGSEAFYYCNGLTSITIGNGVTSIGDGAFSGCSGLTSVHISDLSAWCNIEFGGDDANPLYYAKNLYLNGELLTNLIIPDGINKIKNYAFSHCTGLTSVTIPNSVTSIEYSAFSNCSGLTSVTIGNSVTSIGNYAFSGCSGLTSITIPNSVTSIGYSALTNTAWYNNQPDGVVYAGKVLYKYKGTMPTSTSITIKDGTLGIASWAFGDNTNLTSITIPNSVTNIGVQAFYSCRGLTSITIPNSVTSIGDSAFKGCYNLKTVYNNTSLDFAMGSTEHGYIAYYANVVIAKDDEIQDNFLFRTKDGVHSLIKYIGNDSIIILPANYKNENYIISDRAFSYCTSLTDVTILSNIKTISKLAFKGCTNLQNITIPSSVTLIDSAAFCDCTALTEINIPRSVTNIGDYAFRGCSGLTSIETPNSVEELPKGLFYECSGLKSVTISDCVTEIGRDAFYDCVNLKDIEIGDNVQIIGNSAFAKTGLNSITIPASVTSIGSFAFFMVSTIEDVVFEDADSNLLLGNNKYSDGKGGGLFEDCPVKRVYIGRNLTFSSENDDYNRPQSNALFARWWSNNYSKLTTAIIGPKVTSLPKYLFEDCKDLTTVISNIPVSTLCSFDKTAEGFLPSNATLYVPVQAKEIYAVTEDWKDFGTINEFAVVDDILYNITSEENASVEVLAYVGAESSITVPQKITILDKEYDVTGICGMAFYNNKKLTNITLANSIKTIGSEAFYYCSGLTSVTIGNSVTTIGSCAFDSCSGLTSIEIPNSVTSIGEYAFSGCSGLTSVTIPNSVTSIGERAFQRCSGLASIEIPNSVTSIGEGAFAGCHGLTSVTIPNSVTSIGNRAFSGCSGLTSIEIPNSVTSIGVNAFYNCSGLTSVTIGNSVTTIGSSAFDSCSGLTSIEIPNSVTSIGYYAFSGCSGLTSITIPNSVTSIGDRAFDDCTGLKEIYVKADTPPSAYSYTFSGVPTASATLYVPIGTKAAYQVADGWKKFGNIVEMEFTGIDEVVDEVKGENSKVKDVYDLSGRKVTNPTKGIYIVNGKKVLLK